MRSSILSKENRPASAKARFKSVGFLALVIIALSTASGCSLASDTIENEAVDALLTELLESSVITDSRAFIDEQLASGVSKPDLIKEIESQAKEFGIDGSILCIQKELINGSTNSEIIENCRDTVKEDFGKLTENIEQ